MTGLIPAAIQNIVQALNQPDSVALSLGVLFAGMTFFWIFSQTASYLMDIAFFPVVNDAIRRLTYNSIEKMHGLSLLNSKRLESAEVLSATSRISLSARLFFKEVCLSVFPAIAKLIIALALIGHIAGINILFITSLAACLAIVYLLLPKYIQSRRQAWAYTDARAVKMIDSLINTKIVRFAFTPEMDKLNDYLEREANGWRRTVNWGNLLNILLTSIFGLCTGSILYTVVINKMYPLENFIYLQTLLFGVFVQFRRAFSDIKSLAESYIDVEKILTLIDAPTLHQLNSNVAERDNTAQYDILCNNVTFGYSEEHPILQDLSFRIVAGEKVGIIGNNGSGKSTLCHLLAGFYSPQKGVITIAGIEPSKLAQHGHSQILYFLPQDQSLFHGTFYENLVYGSGRPSKEKVAEAIALMGLQDVIDRLPQGLHSPLGEFGKLISGGERQRLALARALILQPQILICDESLHSIDSRSERQILKSIFNHIPTVILITHRESSLALCNKVYEVKNGQVIQNIDSLNNLLTTDK
jgi:ATP-binding cassette subfamily B protein